MSITIRLLREDDLPTYIQLLGQLTEVKQHTNEELVQQFKHIQTNPHHNIFVMTNENILVGCATLLIEPKMIRGMKPLAHVEDVVVHKSYRKHNFGKTILEFLIEESRRAGCYKVTLGCSPHNIEFYKKIGFLNGNHQMIYYINDIPKSKL